MTVDEVAEYLRIPKSSVYKLAQESRIPCQKVGRHWRFRRQAINRWLGKEPVNADEDAKSRIRPMDIGIDAGGS